MPLVISRREGTAIYLGTDTDPERPTETADLTVDVIRLRKGEHQGANEVSLMITPLGHEPYGVTLIGRKTLDLMPGVQLRVSSVREESRQDGVHYPVASMSIKAPPEINILRDDAVHRAPAFREMRESG